MHKKTTRIVLRYPLHYLQAMHLSGAQAFQQFSALFLPSMRIFNVVDDIYIYEFYMLRYGANINAMPEIE